MSAELALLTKANGGCIIWVSSRSTLPVVYQLQVQRAFGDFVGYVSAQSSMALNVTNLAVLVVLFLDYLESASPLEPWQRWLASAAFVFTITIINLNGMRSCSEFAIFVSLFNLT